MAPTILPTRQHFDVVCHETSKHIFAEALKEDPYQGNGIVLIQPLVNIPVQTLYKVLDCALHIFFGVVFPFMCEGKTAVYFITCAVVLDPLQCAAQIVSQIVRIAASLLGIVSTTASLYGWWFAEVIELTALQGFTALYDRLQVKAYDNLFEDIYIQPKNAVEFFGEDTAECFAHSNPIELQAALRTSLETLLTQLIKSDESLMTKLLSETASANRVDKLVLAKIKQEKPSKGSGPMTVDISGLNKTNLALLYWYFKARLPDALKTQFRKELQEAYRACAAVTAFGTASYYGLS